MEYQSRSRRCLSHPEAFPRILPSKVDVAEEVEELPDQIDRSLARDLVGDVGAVGRPRYWVSGITRGVSARVNEPGKGRFLAPPALAEWQVSFHGLSASRSIPTSTARSVRSSSQWIGEPLLLAKGKDR